jgi:hypothetical protein
MARFNFGRHLRAALSRLAFVDRRRARRDRLAGPSPTMMRPRWYGLVPALPCLALACAVLGCQTDEPGNPMPPVAVITGAEFVDGSEMQEKTARPIRIPGERVAELRRLFDGSRIDPDPARWAEKGKLKLFLKGGGTEVYDIYWTGKGPGAYADHLRRYFRGGSDAAFVKFLDDVEQTKSAR